jgi:hypothetical protein
LHVTQAVQSEEDNPIRIQMVEDLLANGWDRHTGIPATEGSGSEVRNPPISDSIPIPTVSPEFNNSQVPVSVRRRPGSNSDPESHCCGCCLGGFLVMVVSCAPCI